VDNEQGGEEDGKQTIGEAISPWEKEKEIS
jgi:hypothetical protein